MKKIELKKREELAELRGIAKILDCLWENSANEKHMDDRIEKELIYFFGKNWAKDMYVFAKMMSQHPVMPRPLKEIVPHPKTKG